MLNSSQDTRHAAPKRCAISSTRSAGSGCESVILLSLSGNALTVSVTSFSHGSSSRAEYATSAAALIRVADNYSAA